MQALKMKVQIHDNQIAARLPVPMPDGEAEIIVLCADQAADQTQQTYRQSLFNLFAEIDQSGHPRMKKEDADAYLAEERASWN